MEITGFFISESMLLCHPEGVNLGVQVLSANFLSGCSVCLRYFNIDTLVVDKCLPDALLNLIIVLFA